MSLRYQIMQQEFVFARGYCKI